MSQSLLTEAAKLLPDLVALRRCLHREPEIGLDLPKTQATVLAALEGLDLEITLGTRTTSIAAVLRGGKPGPTVLLRGDMDALPIEEPAGLEYASTNGNMHACGHDLHTAGLVGAARLLHSRRANLSGDVVFMFQPGEEGYDGAAVMLEEGLLDVSGSRPVAAFVIHNSPGERGVIATRPGPILAGSATLTVHIHGTGGHGAQPYSAANPVPAVAELAGALQTMVTQRFNVFDPVILGVTQLSGGEAVNVIPASASLGATVRMISQDAQERLGHEIRTVAEGVAAAHGCTAEVIFTLGYPVTINHEAETAAAVRALTNLFGGARMFEMPSTAMGSEDFSRVLQKVPGTYFFMRASPPELSSTDIAFNHSSGVLFDDSVLADQSAALAHLAMTALVRHT